MDPTPGELAAFNTLADAMDWCGLPDALRVALKAGMGPLALMREVVLIPTAVWEATLALPLRVTPPNEAERDVLPMEIGQVGSLRRVCRLRCGLTAMEGVLAPPLAGLGPVVGVAPPHPVIAGRKVKISSVVDQGDDSEIIPMDPARLRALLAAFRHANDGEDPQEEEEITGDQLAGLDSKIQSGVAPYADFGVWRPFGARLDRSLKFVALVLDARGQWVRKEISGPANFTAWLTRWKVLRIGLRVLEAVADARCSLYRDRIYRMNDEFGEKFWWLIAQADIRMRSEQMERIYRKCLLEDQALRDGGTPGGLVGFDRARPWDLVFKLAATDDAWWAKEVDKKVLLHATRLHDASELLDDGVGEISMGGQIPRVSGDGSGPTAQKRSAGAGGNTDGDAPPKKKKKKAQGSGGGSGGGKNGGGKGKGKADGGGKGSAGEKTADGRYRRASNGREICWAENHRADGCSLKTDCTRMHVCEFCRSKDHKSTACPQMPAGWTPP
jgi:hypothetical protein